jgi:hypothetical protein
VGALLLAEQAYGRMALQRIFMARMLERFAGCQRMRAGKPGVATRWTATLRSLRRSSVP